MPPAVPQSVEDFLATVEVVHLLDAGQLSAARALAAGDAHVLAAELIRRDWLTPFQANQLLQGRGRSLLLGSYVLLEKLGEGGMGMVYKARNWKLGQTVALKLIRRERLAAPQAAVRFLREVRASAAVDHPHIVRALDADEVDGACFLVMEYVPGVNLHQHVQLHGPLPIAAACEAVRQTALALQCLHEAGLVHRDIKPGNLLLTGSPPRVKLLDLGLASLGETFDDGSPTLTREGQLVGTPDFVAPEQIVDARTADIRSDLYSLGCTFYFLLTGQVPFPGGTTMQKLDRHRFNEPAPLSGLRADVPVGVAAVVRRLMARHPNDRFQMPAALADSLARLNFLEAGPESLSSMQTRLVEERGAADTVPTGSPSTGPSEPIIQLPAEYRRRPPRSRRRLIAALAGLVVAVAVGVIAWLLLRPREKPIERPDTFEVLADDGWQDSGIDVAEDEEVTLVPSGVWRKGQEACSAAGLKRPGRSRGIAPDAPYLCLLARVGDEPLPHPVLQKETLRFGRSGRLYLRMNDLESDGHVGSLKVHIDGGRTGPEVPAPSPTPEEAAATLLDALREKLHKGAMAEQLFRELLELRARYGETWHGRHAGVLLARERSARPSPLDHLNQKSVPAEERQAGQPDNLVGVIGSHRQRAWGSVQCLAVSKDGKRLASCGEDAVRLWDTATMRETALLRGHRGEVHSLAFTPDGRYLVSAGEDGIIRLWDVMTAKERDRVEGTRSQVWSVTFSGDGRILAAAEHGGDQVFLWDMTDGKLTPRGKLAFLEPSAAVNVAFAPAGKRLAVADRKRLRLWDLDQGDKPLAELPIDLASAYSLCFSPDGKRLAVTGGRAIRLWSIAGTKVTPAGELAFPVEAISGRFSPDGRRLAVCGFQGRLALWDVSGEKPTPAGEARAGIAHLAGLAFAPEGKRLFTGGTDGVIRPWDTSSPTLRELSPLETLDSPASAPAFSPDGRHLAWGCDNGSARIWDLGAQPPGEVASLPLLRATVTQVFFSPDGHFLVATTEAGLGLVDMSGPQPREAVKLLAPVVRQAAYAPDGRQVAATTTAGHLLRWDLSAASPAPLPALGETGAGKLLDPLAFSPDAKQLVATAPDDTLRIWDLTAVPPRPSTDKPGWQGATIRALAFRPDGEVLASLGRNEPFVRLWDWTRRPARSRELPRRNRPMAALAWSPDGERLYVLDAGGEITEWRGDRVQQSWSLPGPALGLDVSPDGRLLAVSNRNGTIYLLRLSPPPR